MASNLPQPRLLRTPQNIQVSYELPHRIHTAKVYPTQSANGSSIILYGHENGVRVVWRGGSTFKTPAQTSTTSQKTNGVEGAVISLDSDEDESASKQFQDKVEFKDDEEELDLTRPYPEIIQTLDLHFGTDVLHLAILPTPILKAEGPSWRGIQPLKQKIVFTAACADNSLRLVTLPLIPPSPASKARPEFRVDFTSAYAGKGKWGETVVLLSGHQKPSEGVTLTVDSSISPSDATKPETKFSTSSDPYIIVASCSREVTGLLLLYRVSTKSPQPQIEPFQKVYLASPAKSITFNPSLSGQRSSHLLVTDLKGACRIYDYKQLTKSSEEGSETPAAEQGTWLLSLYVSFQSSKSDQPSHPPGAHSGYGRKTIIDAKWVSGGQAIIVLLNDGEWAIWDIEGVGPGASQGLLGRAGIKGGSMSEYSLSGYIDIGVKARHIAPSQNAGSKFAPMTPSTRKSVEPFGGRAPSDRMQGQISILELPSASSTNPVEESVVFWLGETYIIIPSLAKYWSANSRKVAMKGPANPFNSTSSSSRMIKLEGIDLQGERCSGIEQIINTQAPLGDISNLLILGEHRFTILTTQKQAKVFKTRVPSERLALGEKSTNVAGDLDVTGIDHALAAMENGRSKRGKLFE
ncbi:hypothetical protein G7Y89_g268 [Cudoniella acicularis]|uniref:Nucleoporin NUP37 n=1 Tax=Cudoniella acicularis TaxID=354080 RepID=A0A8H4W913_9HELO|nr:hypothetical protein G7Y89_g268 [Cudoniella acicularis]